MGDHQPVAGRGHSTGLYYGEGGDDHQPLLVHLEYLELFEPFESNPQLIARRPSSFVYSSSDP
jgi:hypothetical protein